MSAKYKGKVIFLLGGQDLEMKTISELLKDHGIPYADHKLHWHNAHASSYKRELEQYGNNKEWTIYGIELTEDTQLPSNYITIDHHGRKSDRPSALEQVAAILGMKLSHFQTLIAINDKLYIPGMIQAGATEAEIQEIRKNDRMAQGITEEEESKAVLSIQNNLTSHGDLIVVHSCTSCFSPICDKLYPYKRLLIYTDEEFTYYGEGVSELQTMFQEAIHENKIYYGGGDKGYLGCDKGSFSKDQIVQLVNKIISNENV